MWLSSLNMLPPVLMIISVIISCIQVIDAFYKLIILILMKKGGNMEKSSLFSKRVWNLGGRKSYILT